MAASWLLTCLAIAYTCIATSHTFYRHLQKSCINHDCSAVRITISNPPINLFDANMVVEFNSFLAGLSHDNSTKVVVVSSNVPDFYLSHLDANIFLGTVTPALNVTDIITKYFTSQALLTSTPVVFIAEVNGRTWGAGNEQVMHMDMRFAGPDAQFSTPEVGLGVMHVGGLQQLTKLIGSGRAAEHLLSGGQVDSAEAARIGWVNSAYSSKEMLRRHVDSLAKRIALFPIEAIRATKAGIAEQGPSRKAIQADMERYNKLATSTAAQKGVGEFLAVSHNQSREWELNLGTNLVQLYSGGSH